MKPEFTLRPQYHRGDFQQYHPDLSFSLSFFWKRDNKNDVGKAIKLCINYLFFPGTALSHTASLTDV